MIVALPDPTAVTTPEPETVAMLDADVCHVALVVTSCFDPSENVAVAVNWPCCPDDVKVDGPVIVIDVSVVPDGVVGVSFLEQAATMAASTNATSAMRDTRAMVDPLGGWVADRR